MTTYCAKWARGILCVLLLSGLVPASPAAAQDRRALAAAADLILGQFPAAGPAQRDRLAAFMLAGGEPGLAEFTRRLVPAGSGNDVAVRWAVNAMAVFASQAGNDARRAVAERALVTALAAAPDPERAFVSALAAAADPEVRTFLLSQLRLVGREPAVRAAAPFLSDAALVEPATQLMLTVRSAPARAALLAALDKAIGPGQITIVKALGELKAAEAHDRLLTFARDPNPAMRKDALAALARIASPRSFALFAESAKAVAFTYEPGNTMGALMEYARQLGKKGDIVTTEKVCRFVMANTDDDKRLPTKAAALAILADMRGPAALPDLLKAVDHASPEYRNAALMHAERIRAPEAVRQWIAKAQKADPERRAEIIAMLGRQGDARALPFIRTSLATREPEVMLAAAEALAHMEHAKAAPDLLALLKAATGDAVEGVAGILLWTIDEQHLDPLAAMLDTLQPQARAAAIGIIGARGGRRFAARIIPLTSDANPEIRAAAFGALAGVASASDLPALLKMLDSAEGDLVAPIQRAVVAAVGQITPDTARAAPLAQAMRTSPHADRLVELLPQVGGPQALATAIAQFESGSADAKAAAFRALTRWPGTDAADRLFAIFAAGDAAYRNTAFSAFVRQISQSQMTPEQKLPQLKKALDRSSTVGDRRILIRALERIKTLQSLQLVAPFMDDPDVGSEAAGAVMRIALPTSAGSSDGLVGSDVRAALTKALGAIKGPQADADKDGIRAYLAAMPRG